MKAIEAYKKLLEWSKKVCILDNILELLEWDQRCYIPEKGNESRAEQIAYMTKLRHELVRSHEVDEWIDTVVSKIDSLDYPREDVLANIREWRRWHIRAVKVPTELARRLAEVTSIAEGVWASAKANSNWNLLKPYLSEIFKLKKEEAEAVGYTSNPYDALLDHFEPEMTTDAFKTIVENLKPRIKDILTSIISSKKDIDDSFFFRRFPVPIQKKFINMIAKRIGYDFSAGRIDDTAHPFTVNIGKGDVRIAIRYDEHDLRTGLFSAVHEIGHALYDQGLDPENAYTPIGMSMSLGLHESQSRFWENIVARSRGFWVFFYPRLLQNFPILADIPLDAFWKGINKISPSLIRTEADELTYMFHIILRFEIEHDLISGKLIIEDLPDVWNAKMVEYLGIKPANHSSGLLQDVHWSAGLVGYFPTYLLGSTYAVQLSKSMEKELGTIDELCSRGMFLSILEWLRNKIHRNGCRYTPPELIKKITGSYPSAHFFVEYIKSKAEKIYGV